MHHIKRQAPWIAVGLLAFYGILSLLISAQESATFDEKAHIPSAYSYVRYGDMRLNPEHPPLLKDLAGLPLLFLDVKFPIDTPEWQYGINEQWTLGDLFMNCTNPNVACNNSDAILFWSRLPITLIALLLGLFLFLWGRELGGALAGLIAVSLFVFDPNTIAHGHYVTTDIGIAAFLFFAFSSVQVGRTSFSQVFSSDSPNSRNSPPSFFSLSSDFSLSFTPLRSEALP